MHPPFSSPLEFESFLDTQAARAPEAWTPQLVDDLGSACVLALSRDWGWRSALQLMQVWDTVLDQGFDLPLDLAARLVASGDGEWLARRHIDYPGQVPSFSQAATHPMDSKEEGAWTTPLHQLADNAGDSPSCFKALKEAVEMGADANALDGNGLPPLAHCSSMGAARALLSAGANPALSASGHHALDKILAYGPEVVVSDSSWLQEWVQTLSGVSGEHDRVGVAFALARSGQHHLLEKTCGSWGWEPDRLDSLTQQCFADGSASWTWPGWQAYHTVIGVRTGCAKTLLSSLARLGPGGVDELPNWDRMWIAVALFNENKKESRRGARSNFSARIQGAIKTFEPLIHDPDLLAWAHTKKDLPLQSGGFIRYRALRSWLLSGLSENLESRPVPPSSWPICERFLIEDLQGEERMSSKDYQWLRQEIMRVAMETAPADPSAPPASVVVLAMMRCLEYAQQSRSLSSLPAPKNNKRIDPQALNAWVELDFSTVSWSDSVRQVITQAHDRLDVNLLAQVCGDRGMGEVWRRASQTLCSRVQAAHLESVLSSPSVPTRRPSSRF